MQAMETRVIAVDELPWRDPKGLPGILGSAFAEKELVNDPTFTGSYSFSLTRFTGGAVSTRHVEKWNHAIYVLSGSGKVEIDGTDFPVKPQTLIKVKAGEWHSISNTGEGEM